MEIGKAVLHGIGTLPRTVAHAITRRLKSTHNACHTFAHALMNTRQILSENTASRRGTFCLIMRSQTRGYGFKMHLSEKINRTTLTLLRKDKKQVQ